MSHPPRRSNAPIFWLLFGAGGMLAALFGSVLVFLTGLAVPLGWIDARLMSHARVSAWLGHPLCKLVAFALVSLFAWHAVHRLFHSLHDVGVPTGWTAKLACYGSALAITLAVGAGLLAIG